VCWIYGIIGSSTGAYLFYESAYYSEAMLYLFYAIIGVYAFYFWYKKANEQFKIKRMQTPMLLGLLAIGSLGTFGLGYLSKMVEGDRPFFDAFSSSFGIIATFLEMNKYLISWVFWIVLNLYSIWLYGVKDLNLMAIQMIVYTVLSIYGLMEWSKKLKQ
jgi:nicotinamide mononucleotide transporter